MPDLESRLRAFASLDADGQPSGLTRLLVRLNRFPRDDRAIDSEEQEYILAAAFFLHDLLKVVERVDANYPSLGEQDREVLRQVCARIRGTIEDFRLQESIKKKVTGDARGPGGKPVHQTQRLRRRTWETK